MADSDRRRVDFGLKADLTAMDSIPRISSPFLLDDTRAMRDALTVKIPRLGVSSNGGWPHMDTASVSNLRTWLTEAGLTGKSETALLDGSCRRALDAGLPIARTAKPAAGTKLPKPSPSVVKPGMARRA